MTPSVLNVKKDVYHVKMLIRVTNVKEDSKFPQKVPVKPVEMRTVITVKITDVWSARPISSLVKLIQVHMSVKMTAVQVCLVTQRLRSVRFVLQDVPNVTPMPAQTACKATKPLMVYAKVAMPIVTLALMEYVTNVKQDWS
jgi:hypothetical protein